MGLKDEQIDKMLSALDDVALAYGDEGLPGLALNSRGLERSRQIVRAAQAHTTAAEPRESDLQLMKFYGVDTLHDLISTQKRHTVRANLTKGAADEA